MTFPDRDRVIYQQNPLIEVLCQLRFTRLMPLETRPPGEFQERIRAWYPKSGDDSSVSLQLVSDSDTSSPLARRPVYRFYDREAEWEVQLSSTFLVLLTTQYRRWETFRERIEILRIALEEVFAIDTYARIGLRYRDLIRPADLGLGEAHWDRLLAPHMATLHGTEVARAGALLDTFTTARFKLDGEGCNVHLQHGPVTNQETQECGYLIDSDFYRDKETGKHDVASYLDQFNSESRRLFRWCISHDLHEKLGPQEPD